MARIKKREDVIALSSRKRLHVEINNVVVDYLFYVEVLYRSHDNITKYSTALSQIWKHHND